ncbi:DUF4340 domain-containing protein [Paraliomyxa miuraensis]|uniref:DUF4340 domain-containing protein n=1 Tax=Paraliomyxa miuraensis TaxID=376150 RepID=UPI0022574577|nr:DUF4340 domain-containing protein [Paraliomyxa miuraensis]MCX4245743.1 DUF4340 domain-containing protein [Paraliomyxa miuraensis]
MNRMTIIMVALALGSAATAWSMRPQELPPVQFEDTGEALFPDFTDPTIATALSVVAWDEDEAKVVSFEVEQKEGRWVIPSHNDYPADGTERMGKAAASFIDVEKDRYYGDDPANHAAFGVLDPDGPEGKGDEKGQRITIKDASGTVLVDIIVGKQIEDRMGYYYVRMPSGDGSKRVYGTKLSLDISTKFEDWIEKDLLDVDRDDFISMIYDPYTVDEVEGKVTGFNPIKAQASDPTASSKQEWQSSEGTEVPEGKQLDSMKVRQMLTQMANLKIVGVRPRPQVRNMIEQQILAQDMKRKGFFIVPTADGRAQLYGNEGSLTAITEDGMVYSLLFGEVTYESGISLSAGVAADPAASDDPDKGVMEEGVEPEEGEGDTNKTASRFLFVDVVYDDSLDRTLEKTDVVEDPAAPATDPEEAARIAADNETKKQAGKEREAKLRKRFDQWFYVISDANFKQIHKARDEMWKDGPAPAPVPTDGGEEG